MTAINLLGSINANYTIIKQGHEAVIGERETQHGTQYVAWNYSYDGKQASYFWGRYGSKDYAVECFHKKEQGLYSGD